MRTNPLVGLAIAFAAGLLFGPAAHAQVGECPENICVESQTSLVYNPQTNTMDAFTTSTTDYSTAYWYDLCVNLAVMRVNGPYVVNWDILLPSATPSYCSSGAVELEQSGSVAATPGRQYFAEGLVELHVYYTYSDIVYDCGQYCNGYWYDAEGYSLLSTSQPSNANWPSIEYSYPYSDQPQPVYQDALAMSGSGAAAWAPPVIYSVSPNQWPAGATTTFTISGAGFGYSPTLSIGGNGITGYMNPCAQNPSSSCDRTIVATVTIDASTPANTQETITLTAGGQNPSGFLPVDIGQQGEATATAQVQPFLLSPPQIWFNGNNVTGTTVPVYIGQQIALTTRVNLPSGATMSSQSWVQLSQAGSVPTGTVVGGYNTSNTSGSVVTLPGNGTRQTLREPCLTFYWVDPGSWQWQYTYTYGATSKSAVVTFAVYGPASPGFTAQVGSAAAAVSNGVPGLYLLGLRPTFSTGQAGIVFSSPGLPAPGNQGAYSWVQIINNDQVKLLTNTGVQTCTSPSPLPALDGKYPYGTPGGSLFSVNHPNDTATDNPSVPLNASWGEAWRSFSATMYSLWDPQLPGGCTGSFTCTSIPVPVASMSWRFQADGINTLQPQPTQTIWTVPCGPGSADTCALVAAGSDARQSFPTWTNAANNTFNCR